jgi:hypothetical protein
VEEQLEDPLGAQQGESVIVADDRGEPHVAELHELPFADDEALMQSNRPKDDWISRNGRQRREVKGSWYRRKADFLASKTDLDSSLMRRRQSKGSHLGYYTHYDVVDGGKSHIILNALLTPFELTENAPMLELLWRTSFRWRQGLAWFTQVQA